MSTASRINDITGVVIGAAIRVHSKAGPGLLESVYQACLAYELRTRGVQLVLHRPIPIRYGDILIDCAFRADMIVEELVIVELKAVRRIAPVHIAQTLTYLKLSGLPVGLLLNFNVRSMKDGVRRVINADRDPAVLPRL